MSIFLSNDEDVMLRQIAKAGKFGHPVSAPDAPDYRIGLELMAKKLVVKSQRYWYLTMRGAQQLGMED
jgi:hypothetical protein